MKRLLLLYIFIFFIGFSSCDLDNAFNIVVDNKSSIDVNVTIYYNGVYSDSSKTVKAKTKSTFNSWARDEYSITFMGFGQYKINGQEITLFQASDSNVPIIRGEKQVIYIITD